MVAVNKERGFTLLELMLVLVIIALLSVYLLSRIEPVKDKSYNTLIDFQAGVFSRNINALYCISQAKDQKVIDHQGVKIFFNEYGWPSNTSPTLSPMSNNQTPLECLQLWKAIFNNPLDARLNNENSGKFDDLDSRYRIYAIEGKVCRYQVIGNRESVHFFDYDLRTGTVIVSSL